MPQNEYTIRDPQSGLVITVRGDAPPNEAQLDELFAAARTRGADTPGEEPMSLSGFAGNVLKSGGRFVRDTVQGANTLAEMITPKTTIERGLRLARDPIGESRRMAETVRSIPGIARALPGAIGTAAKERYGSAEAIKNTLYKDPVGVLSDVSTVLPAGAALKATKAPALVRLGSKAVRAADMIDPLSQIGRAHV